jgi:hypothetical protein
VTEADVLARAEDLPSAREVAGVRFAPIFASPLLIARVRGPGGAGGRRITAGVCVEPTAFAVLVEGSGRGASLTAYGSVTACAHAFGDALARAARDGLGASPEPVPVSAERLLALAGALLG